MPLAGLQLWLSHRTVLIGMSWIKLKGPVSSPSLEGWHRLYTGALSSPRAKMIASLRQAAQLNQ